MTTPRPRLRVAGVRAGASRSFCRSARNNCVPPGWSLSPFSHSPCLASPVPCLVHSRLRPSLPASCGSRFCLRPRLLPTDTDSLSVRLRRVRSGDTDSVLPRYITAIKCQYSWLTSHSKSSVSSTGSCFSFVYLTEFPASHSSPSTLSVYPVLTYQVKVGSLLLSSDYSKQPHKVENPLYHMCAHWQKHAL